MTRPCVVVEVTRRSDDLLRERLWVDRASMLPLRRETYGLDGDLARLASYLALDLRPGEVRLTDRVSAPELPAGQITALRAGGWALPDALPGGYELVAVYAGGARPSRTDAAAVHAIYSDGLYAVSLFEQAGLPGLGVTARRRPPGPWAWSTRRGSGPAPSPVASCGPAPASRSP